MKQIGLDACIYQPSEQISDPPRSMPQLILCNQSMWPVNQSPYSQGQISPPNPMCAFMTQHMCVFVFMTQHMQSLQMKHKDGGYSALLLNTDMSDTEH